MGSHGISMTHIDPAMGCQDKPKAVGQQALQTSPASETIKPKPCEPPKIIARGREKKLNVSIS